MSFDLDDGEIATERNRCESIINLSTGLDDDSNSSCDESVKVFVRIRPLNKRELNEKQVIGWDFTDTSMLEDTQNGQRVYAYDHCFGPNSTNQETYDLVGKPVVLKAMEGYNGTVFTYGQTGSGKTWTMRGCESDPGMMVLCIRDILEWTKKNTKVKYTLRVSYLEVYNEEINDLLGDPGNNNSKNLKIVSEDATRGAVIGNLVEEIAQTSQDFNEILKRGESSRSYASTEMNNESSRSHTIYRVAIESHDYLVHEDGTVSHETIGAGKISYLNLVDLAGSERQKSTKAEGKTLKEGANINKSLLALGAVINKLGEQSNKKLKGGKAAFVPYRDSKLTRILKQSLGGNTLTSVICAVSPAPMHREETVSSLKFGQLCKSIKNSVKSNDGAVDDKTLLRQYRNQITELKALLEATTSGASIDTALTQALSDKSELESKLKGLEQMIISGGGSMPANLGSFSGTLGSSSMSGVSSSEEVMKLNEKIAEQQLIIAELHRSVEEYEEYEQHTRAMMDEETAKLEVEKQSLQNERYKLLKDRSYVEEKETRIMSLFTNIEEKESKLKHMKSSMNEQLEQWQRSITDLKRREDLVEDWQRNHQERERRLVEANQLQETKFAELNRREAEVSMDEGRIQVAKNELQEREQRLQVALNRVTVSEHNLAALEEKLNGAELSLKKRETDGDMRERELLSRRKELESWDVLLREKDRKVSSEQKDLDERQTTLRVVEDKIKQKEMDTERKLQDVDRDKKVLNDSTERYTRCLVELEVRERDNIVDTQKLQLKGDELKKKEQELNVFEKKLLRLQELVKDLDKREAELNVKVIDFQRLEDDFYNVRVAQITARHNQELKQLESLVGEQLKIVSNFQSDLDASNKELQLKSIQLGEHEEMLIQRNRYIEELKEQLAHLNDNSRNTATTTTTSSSTNEVDLVLEPPPSSPIAPFSPVPITTTTNNNNKSIASSRHDFPPPISTDSKPNHHHHQSNNSNNNNNNNSNNNNPITSITNRNSSISSSQDFMVQLAVTHRMLYQILDKHDAVPDVAMKLSSSKFDKRQQQLSESKASSAIIPSPSSTSYHPISPALTTSIPTNRTTTTTTTTTPDYRYPQSDQRRRDDVGRGQSSSDKVSPALMAAGSNGSNGNGGSIGRSNAINHVNMAITEEKSDHHPSSLSTSSSYSGKISINTTSPVTPKAVTTTTTATRTAATTTAIASNTKLDTITQSTTQSQSFRPTISISSGTHISAYTSPPINHAGTFSSRRDLHPSGHGAPHSFSSSSSSIAAVKKKSSSPYTSPDATNSSSTSSSVITSGERRNGIPVTTVDLSILSGGIKRLSPNNRK